MVISCCSLLTVEVKVEAAVDLVGESESCSVAEDVVCNIVAWTTVDDDDNGVVDWVVLRVPLVFGGEIRKKIAVQQQA